MSRDGHRFSAVCSMRAAGRPSRGSLGFGDEGFLRFNGAGPERDPCPGGGEVFDSSGQVTSIRSRNYHYDLCTRIGRGRWRSERIPIGAGPIYATAPGLRVLAGSTYEPLTGDGRAIVSFASDRGPRAAPRRPARSRPR